MFKYSVLYHIHDIALPYTGADPGFEKGGGAGGSGASFWAYSGQFMGLLKKIGAKNIFMSVNL